MNSSFSVVARCCRHPLESIPRVVATRCIRVSNPLLNSRFVTTDAAGGAASSFTTPATPFTQPATLNSYHGTAVYENIGLASSTSEPPTSKSATAAFRRNADPESVHFVTGASRGMGLEYVKSLLVRTQGTIVAACRNPDQALQLHNFLSMLPLEDFNRVKVVELDITNQTHIDKAATEMEASHGRVDTLFNVAGVLGNPNEGDAGPERNLKMLDGTWLEQQFKVNVIGPMVLTKALAPLMASKKGRTMTRAAETVVVNMSARVASLSDNTGPLGWHSYRMSKAALNMGTRTISHELKRQGTWAIALYPGMTDTDMSKPFQKGVKPELIFPVSFTVKRMLDVVNGMEEKHSGGFYDWAGQALPF